MALEAALGRPVDIAIDQSAVALAVHSANHPQTRHLTADIWEVRPRVATMGRPVDVLWASPDCTHFSRAKGNLPRKQGIRSLAWAVVRWAKDVRPRVIFLENVAEFRGWGPLDATGRPDRARMGETFGRWRRQLERLGYVVDHRVLDASLYGAPTRRRRLFVVARCDGEPIVWPEPTHGPGGLPLHTAAECIDWSLPCPSIFERRRPLAQKTLRRIAQGIRRFVLEAPEPFLVRRGGDGGERGPRRPSQRTTKPLGTCVGGQQHALVAAFIHRYFGGPRAPIGSRPEAPLPTVTAWDHHSVVEVRACLTAYYGAESERGQTLREPLRTVTARDRLGLLTVEGIDYQITDIGLRMLEPHELLRAQFGRYAATYDLSRAPTKAAKVRLVGNSVCPEVAEALVRANTGDSARRAT